MISNPSFGIGERLAKYRRIAGLSAQKLSDKTEGRISRGTIARIESGAKVDLTIDEVVLLCLALGISPVALVLPLETPGEPVELWQGVKVPVSSLRTWFLGGQIELNVAIDEEGDVEDIYGTAATIVTNEIIESQLKDEKLTAAIHRSVHPYLEEEFGGSDDESSRDELLAEQDKVRAKLKMLGVTPTSRQALI